VIYKTMKRIIVIATLLVSLGSFVAPVVLAQGQVPAVNINQGPTSPSSPYGGFRLVICDGPTLPANIPPPTNLGHDYVPCDFQHLMIQAQYLINVMIVLGVLGALIGFSYAGYLYMTGTQPNLAKAKSIFPNVFWGFILMLTAWFVVYQILSWLTGNAAAYLGGS
jgi:hypothetical protein